MCEGSYLGENRAGGGNSLLTRASLTGLWCPCWTQEMQVITSVDTQGSRPHVLALRQRQVASRQEASTPPVQLLVH